MIITSELTGKKYKTVDECLAAERAYKEQKEREAKAREEQKKREEQARKDFKEKSDQARKELVDAWKTYMQLYVDAGYSMDTLDKMYLFYEVILNA